MLRALLYNHTLTVSNEVPSLPQYLGIMWGLEDLLEAVSSGEEPYIDIGPDLKGGFEAAKETLTKWGNLTLENDIYYAAHVLDPRIKLTLIKEQYGDQADEVIERVKAYFKRQYPAQSSTPASHIQQHKSDFERYFNDLVITSYEPCEDWCLQWWKANEFQYKQVAVAARDLLAIPSAEVDVERLFSEGRDTLGIHRMALDVDTIRMVRLMKSYYDQIDKKKRLLAEKEQAEHTAVYGVRLNSFISGRTTC
ncbi:uncharacterized protein K444DRAFT_601551 [Hyaloscypha bicolor E]|uniref:HAT C-terminal dimerisation domain-containing protein n=1 Tax=Hyaloscypha bicolor E TaxID=1095630 RepID=A0A2J6SKH7_9HELO|nr:uncharacterized protein K444DRAFT_601551 [Hyaloscypha bicolor E]PMD51266.1 hypothetical protein K444DRAFT_601551 [Hyaloscypha bicolor E]